MIVVVGRNITALGRDSAATTASLNDSLLYNKVDGSAFSVFTLLPQLSEAPVWISHKRIAATHSIASRCSIAINAGRAFASLAGRPRTAWEAA